MPTTITDEHAQTVLIPRAIDPVFAAKLGVFSVAGTDDLPPEFSDSYFAATPALVFPWRSPSGVTILQLRPDTPIENKHGDPVKYVFPTGAQMVLNRILEPAIDAPVLLCEGTCQSLAAAQYAPQAWAVYGLSGCWSWRKGSTQVAIPDLSVMENRQIVVALDADAATNLNVYEAGQALADALMAEGADSVTFLQLPGAGAKAGLDDVLGSRPADKRASWLERQVFAAEPKPAKTKPKGKKVTKPGAGVAYIDPQQGGLQVVSLAKAVEHAAPVLLTQEDRIAVYSGGVFGIDGTVLTAIVGDLLGEQYRKSHRENVSDYLTGQLSRQGRRAPLHSEDPLLNVKNGMLDLVTGTLKPHDPSYRSTVQIPVEWDPAAKAPTYTKWLHEAAGDQSDDLEEAVSMMLDPSRTPPKAVFLYGPSRSGKSTFIRLMERIVGPGNHSGVTLHQLSDDRFMAANIYGKMLNSAADLSGAQVEDISAFKLMTGEDTIQANRKFGTQFSFTNRALFAFSANDLPTVNESSRAYVERIKPFRFDRSFAGHEDPSIEDRMADELPGILVRWVAAWQRRTARGTFLPTDPSVAREFEVRSDRVRQWCDELLTIVPVDGASLPAGQCSLPRALAQSFNRWAEANAGSRMGERKIIDRLKNIEGVMETTERETRKRALNLIPRPEGTSRSEASEQNEHLRSTLHQTREDADHEGEGVGEMVGKVEKEREEEKMDTEESGSLLLILRAHATPADVRPCPDCDAAEQLVPPHRFFYACPNCHPDTFTSGAHWLD